MLNSIVSIESLNEKNDSFGTGFVIHNDDSGAFILTCRHVIEDVQEPMVNEVAANIITNSDFIDMVVIYVPGLRVNPLPLQVDPCDTLHVEVIGFSHFSQEITQKKHIEATLFRQKVELHSNENDDFYVARKIKANNDFTFDRGNSGSPVICKKSAHVIGMISNKRGKEIGYAIEIDNLEKVWKEIPKDLLERGRALHNHLPLDYGQEIIAKKPKVEKSDDVSKKETKIIRYILAGLLSLAIITFVYFFFFNKVATEEKNTTAKSISTKDALPSSLNEKVYLL